MRKTSTLPPLSSPHLLPLAIFVCAWCVLMLLTHIRKQFLITWEGPVWQICRIWLKLLSLSHGASFLAVGSTLKERNFPFAVGLITTCGDGETCRHNSWYFLLCAERTMGAQKSWVPWTENKLKAQPWIEKCLFSNNDDNTHYQTVY